MVNRKRAAAWMAAAIVAAGVTAPLPAQEASNRVQHEARRETWQKVPKIFEAMGVKPGAVVADVGAGDGFFTSRLSAAVGAQGRVLAVDVGTSPLRRLRARVDEEKLSNVEVIEGTPTDPRLPAGTLDAALIVNAYHEMREYRAMLAAIRTALKPGGRLVIVEPISPARRPAAREEQARNHEIDSRFARVDAREAGFHAVELADPFTTRHEGRDVEWMLVLTPPSSDWQDPSLRITPEEFRALPASEVLLLDTRGEEEFRRGALPGAVLMPQAQLEALAKGDPGPLAGERRLIVTYCSCLAEQTSARVALLLKKSGVTNVKALMGGYEEWTARQ